MSYPQPDADQSVVKGNKFFRLNTLLASPGDIYESSQGANAIAIGPDSDISEVLVTYPDPTQVTGINQLVVSNLRSMVGLVPVNNVGQAYLPANRPGKIYMSPNNLWNPDFFPGNPDTDTQILETPRLDVFEYFAPQQSLIPGRRDKTYTYQSVASPDDGAFAWITVPFYGRKYASIVFMHSSGPSAASILVNGVILTYGDQAGNSLPGILVGLAGQLTVGSNVPYTYSVGPAGVAQVLPDGTGINRTIGGGSFDLLSIQVGRTGAGAIGDFFCEITVSDVAAPFGGTMVAT